MRNKVGIPATKPVDCITYEGKTIKTHLNIINYSEFLRGEAKETIGKKRENVEEDE